MMVNDNLGTSVAILGTFSLVRFRSLPGNSREIISIFFAMAIGLAVVMGHIEFAIIITLFIDLTLLILSKISFGTKNAERVLKITIPESLDYTNVFDDIFEKYLNNVIKDKVKLINMGSMYELTFIIN